MKRLTAADRRESILAAGVELAEAEAGNYALITRNQIAAAAGVCGSLVQYHFGTVDKLRQEIIKYAIKHRRVRIVAQALVAGDAQAKKAPEGLRREALELHF